MADWSESSLASNSSDNVNHTKRVSVRDRRNLWERLIEEQNQQAQQRRPSRIYNPVRYGDRTDSVGAAGQLRSRSVSLFAIPRSNTQQAAPIPRTSFSPKSARGHHMEKSARDPHKPVRTAEKQCFTSNYHEQQQQQRKSQPRTKNGQSQDTQSALLERPQQRSHQQVVLKQNESHDNRHCKAKEEEEGLAKVQTQRQTTPETHGDSLSAENRGDDQEPSNISRCKDNASRLCTSQSQLHGNDALRIVNQRAQAMNITPHKQQQKTTPQKQQRNYTEGDISHKSQSIESIRSNVDTKFNEKKEGKEAQQDLVSLSSVAIGMTTSIPVSSRELQRQYVRSNTTPIDKLIHMIRHGDEIEKVHENKCSRFNHTAHCERNKLVDSNELLPKEGLQVYHTSPSQDPLETLDAKNVDISEFEELHLNPLFIEDTRTLNPLYESDIITHNPLYEPEIVVLNPLFDETSYGAIYESTTNIDHEEAKLVYSMRKSLHIRDRMIGIKFKTNCFSGSDLVDWIMDHMKTNFLRADAVTFSQYLLSRCVLKNVNIFDREFTDSSNMFYRFVEDYHSKSVLNSVKSLSANPSDAQRLTKERISKSDYEPFAPIHDIHRKLCFVMEEIISLFTFMNDGKNGQHIIPKHIQLFDYTSFHKSKQYADMQYQVYRLQKCDPMVLQDEERRTFFINLYNILMLHGLMRFGRPANIVMRQRFLKKTKYVVGHFKISLEDIEHIILGSSHRSFSTIGNLFVSNNSRCHSSSPLYYLTVQQRFDPRIHFALITGCISSPKLQVYEAVNLERQLKEITSIYLQNEKLRIDLETREIMIAQQMNWWHDDFGYTTRERLLWAMPYLSLDDQGKLSLLLSSTSENYSIQWMPYNWALNHISLRNQPKLIDQLQFVTMDQSCWFGNISVRRSAASRDASAISAKKKRIQGTSYSSSTSRVVISTGNEIKMELLEVLAHPTYRTFFLKFAMNEQSAENILFWQDVQQFVLIDNDIERAEASLSLFCRYLSHNAPHELNISRDLAMDVKKVIETQERRFIMPSLFDKIKSAVEVNMTDTFERFLSSSLYQDLLGIIFNELDNPCIIVDTKPSADADDEDTYWDVLSDDSEDEDMAGWMSFVEQKPTKGSSGSGSPNNTSKGSDGSSRNINTHSNSSSASVSSGKKKGESPARRTPSKIRNTSVYQVLHTTFSSQNESVVDWTPNMLRERRRMIQPDDIADSS